MIVKLHYIPDTNTTIHPIIRVIQTFIMTLTESAKLRLTESLLVEFQQFANERCDLELSEFLANAANDFLAETFEGKIDSELEAELAGLLIADAFVQV